MSEMNYCCDERCFALDRTQVDGIACEKCNHYCYCVCECKTYKRNVRRFKPETLRHNSNLLIEEFEELIVFVRRILMMHVPSVDRYEAVSFLRRYVNALDEGKTGDSAFEIAANRL